MTSKWVPALFLLGAVLGVVNGLMHTNDGQGVVWFGFAACCLCLSTALAVRDRRRDGTRR